MFRAACVAQCAEEPCVSGNRIVSAMLRTPSVSALCSRLQVEVADVEAVFDKLLDRQFLM